jgi:hypothetical protein
MNLKKRKKHKASELWMINKIRHFDQTKEDIMLMESKA